MPPKASVSPRKRVEKSKNQPSPAHGDQGSLPPAKKLLQSNEPKENDYEPIVSSPPRLSRQSTNAVNKVAVYDVDWAKLDMGEHQDEDDESFDQDIDSIHSSSSGEWSLLSFNLGQDVNSDPEQKIHFADLPVSDDDDDKSLSSTDDEEAKSVPTKNPNLKKPEGDNVPSLSKLPKAFSAFCIDKNTAASYRMSDGDYNSLRDMDVNEPIAPVTLGTLALETALKGAQDDCLELISRARKNIDTPNLWQIIDDLEAQLKDIQHALKNVSRAIKESKKLQGAVESARTSATRAADYWKKRNARRYAKWMKYVIKADLMLRLCDDEKKRQAEIAKAAIIEATKTALGMSAEVEQGTNENQVVDMLNDEEDPDVEEVGATVTPTTSLVLPKPHNQPRKRALKRMNKKAAPATIEERKEKAAENYILYSQYEFYLKGGQSRQKPIDEKLHGLKWEFGAIRCSLCNNQNVSQARFMARHIKSDDHKEAVRKKQDESNSEPLHQQTVSKINPHGVGSQLSLPFLDYRSKGLIAMAKNNVSVSTIIGIAEDWVDAYSGVTLGGRCDLVDLYVGPLLDSLTGRLLLILGGGGCYPEFGSIFDGTPSFAEAEAIIVRAVTKDWEIIELLVKCGLYEKKLKGDDLAAHVVDALKNRCGKDMKHWLTTHQDRASTNKAALTKIEEVEPTARPTKNWCCSHTVSNSGKETLGDKGSAKYAELFRKDWQAVIKTPGNAREKAAELFGESPETANSVRFFNKFEQICQVHKHDPVKILTVVIEYCMKSQSSPVSAAKMMDHFNPNSRSKAALGMAIVEIASIASGLRTFAQGCYTFEGDSCIILRALDVFERMEGHIEKGFDTTGLAEAVDKALPMITSVDRDYKLDCDRAAKAAKTSSVFVGKLKDELKALEESKKAVTSTSSSRGRTVKKTAKTTDTDALEEITNRLVEKRMEVKEARAKEKILKEESAAMNKKYEEWQQKFPHRTAESLMEHGKTILQPTAKYYIKLFKEEGGDCFDIRQLAEGVQIFDPLFLKDIDDETEIVTTLHYLANKLTHCRYRHFTKRFFAGLKEEMEGLVKEAKRDHDLDKIKPSRRYKTRLQKRIRKNKMAEDEVDWKCDAGEYAQRIWQWWKPRRNDFPYHALAIRLVVLTQMSSCSVERVFSKLEMIRKVCGEGLYGDMTEVRLMLQCNGDMEDLVSALKKYTESA